MNISTNICDHLYHRWTRTDHVEMLIHILTEKCTGHQPDKPITKDKTVAVLSDQSDINNIERANAAASATDQLHPGPL
jgi:YbbR domain-containing protein